MIDRKNSKYPCLVWENEYEDFEKIVLNQKSAELDDDFNEEYFTGEWRHGFSTYTLETRRIAEGKNPELIQATFEPTNLLDVGCGPGLLVLMLRELGLNAFGVDASKYALRTAPTEIQDYISFGDILNLPISEASFELVICREVLEHLTVLQVSRAINELCRVSSKYVYVTTRYAHNCKSIFDVETEFEADPTHITCMNKSLLRTLFLLNGYRSRPDLEKSLDWLNKGRVMVYQKTDKYIKIK